MKKNKLTSVLSNLNPKFELRPYQRDVLQKWIAYFEAKEKTEQQFLFHMATGSGKTLVMAALMLHLFSKGYKNVLFFVNSNNIIDKTRHNFLNKNSAKYLFAPTLVDDSHKPFEIKEVRNFQSQPPNTLQVVFSTIQQLHIRLNKSQENALTISDFSRPKTLIISDEAHHMNADTKKMLNNLQQTHKDSWEKTVNKLLNTNTENLLLEFTATADFSNRAIRKKYADKLFFDYSLQQFSSDAYSKEIRLWQSQSTDFERILQALILSQYRKILFAQHGIYAKPVVLVKSVSIKENKTIFEHFFAELLQLTPKKILQLLQSVKHQQLGKRLQLITSKEIDIQWFANEMKRDFTPQNTIRIDSLNDSFENQILLNTLEDSNNPIRLIFAVEKLNEGWDVLNLFDIVKLGKSRTPNKKSSIAEAQLIGRGARYFPFKLANFPDSKRKFDHQPHHPLALCEQLFFHAAYNPSYIQLLTKSLQEIGLQDSLNQEFEVKLNPNLVYSDFFNSAVVVTNKKIKKTPLSDKEIIRKIVETRFVINPQENLEQALFGSNQSAGSNPLLELKIGDFHRAVIRKAMNKIPFFYFDNLTRYFPNLLSAVDFFESDDYFKNITFFSDTKGHHIISGHHKLLVFMEFLQLLERKITKISAQSYDVGQFSVRKSLKSCLKPTKVRKIMNSSDFNRFHQYNVFETHSDFCADEKLQKIGITEALLIPNYSFFSYYNLQNAKPENPKWVVLLKDNKNVVFQIFIRENHTNFDTIFTNSNWYNNTLLNLIFETDNQKVFVF